MPDSEQSWWQAMTAWLWHSPPTAKTEPTPTPPPDHEETVVAEHEDLVRIRVSGMPGEACVETVRKALMGCDGVVSVTVEWKKRIATVHGSGLDPKRLVAAVEAVGYYARPLKLG